MEFDQSKVRFAIETIVLGYLLAAFLWDRTLTDVELLIVVWMIIVLSLAAADFVWMLLRPGINHLRRRAKVVMDMAAVSVTMVLGGEIGALLFAIFPWVIIGNGFRFGRWYLHYSQIVGAAGFACVLLFSEFWRSQLVIGVSCMFVVLGVPWYAAALISRLHAASQRLQEARSDAEAANIAKTKFLAAASHDLRQPMQALSMYASVLEQRVSDPDAARVVQGVQLSCRTLEQLFDGLLDISKIESGVIRPSVVDFPLMPLIEQVVAAERPMAAHKGLQLRVVRCSASVHSDPALLERMLKNLVTNAIRYTERGKIVVGCRRAGNGRLRLEVLDSGIGIDTQEQARIFDEYYQVAGINAQGLGLGLPIVKSLSELLGHGLSLRSAVGRGSAFSIELPLAPHAATPATANHPAPISLAGAKVVVVDDDAEIRSSVRLLLESWGCSAVCGATLGEVQERLRTLRLKPHAVIVDYRLAEAITGLQVIEALRHEFGTALPALIITGTPNLALLRERAGSIPFAMKPVPPGKLRAFLSQALRERLAFAS
ncbi:MAG TPA: ATP-binding protein [Burkholderiales bacterium]|nr:ATP-binding protein [Burkholderiales bacterium]